MFKITNIQATRTIGAVLILLSGNAFAASVSTSYATQTALNTEIAARKAADTTEATARNTAIGTAIATEVSNRNTAIATERTRAIGVEGTLNAADTAEVTSRNAAIVVEAAARDAAIAVETARAKVAEAAGAGTKIADGAHKGDILEWDGFAWTPSAAEPVYILGDIRPNGGIVYYVDGSGRHGLAAQPNDEASSMNWTDAMAAAQAHNALPCPTDILRTPNCWHLPTKLEIEYLFEQQTVMGGFANNRYWSATEAVHPVAWNMYFFGNMSDFDKSTPYLVRAVQAF